MLRLAADENFNGEIVRGLFRRQGTLDIVRIQDVGLLDADDPTVLEWAALEGRILLTHDRATMPDFAYDRVRSGLQMPGVFVASDRLPIGQAIEDILLLASSSEHSEWEGIVLYLPL
jgi:hypothetical protein